jgi:hypothetical protein
MYNDQDALHNKSEWPEYKAGQLVYAWKTPRTLPNPKLASEWEEAIILTQTGPSTFRIHRPNRVRKKDTTINAKHLKPRPTIDEPGPPTGTEQASLVVHSEVDPQNFTDLLQMGYSLTINGGRNQVGVAQPQEAAQPHRPQARRPQRTYAQREARRLANYMQDPPTTERDETTARHAATRSAMSKAIATSSRKMATRTVKLAKRLVTPPHSQQATMRRTATTSDLTSLIKTDNTATLSPSDDNLATLPGTSTGIFSYLAPLLSNPFAQAHNSPTPTNRPTFEQCFQSPGSSD